MRKLAWLWCTIFWVLGVGFPLFSVLFRGGINLSVLADPDVLFITRVTLEQAALSTAFSLWIGLPLGLWVGRERDTLSRLFLAIPYGVPTVVVGATGVLWLGKHGFLSGSDWLYSLKAVVLAHVFLNAPWVALLISQARDGVPREQLQAAATLGARFPSRLRFVLWPYLRGTLANAGVQVFTLCTVSFALVLLLGGGPPVQTLETAIYAKLRTGTPDFSGALACTLWQLGLGLAGWLSLLVLRARVTKLPAAAPPLRARRPALGKIAVCALWILPYFGLLAKSGLSRWFTDPALLLSLKDPILISTKLALGASFLAILTAAAAVLTQSAWLNTLLSLPSGISVLVLGMGFWLGYSRWIDPFEGSFLAILVLQGVLFVPLALRTFWPLVEATQARALEAAATLGASPWRAFWFVEWPRWRGPLLATAAIIAAASLGEVAAVSLFYSENLVPLPLVLTRWMAQYRFADAQALAAMLFLLSAGTITAAALTERIYE
jgi:thiamine transport system permease protein